MGMLLHRHFTEAETVKKEEPKPKETQPKRDAEEKTPKAPRNKKS